jgi:hypothetical protein
MTEIVPLERIASKIYVIHQMKVMFDSDLADLYGVETGALNRAVKRNIERFPDDFMFQLSMEEWNILKCQSGISKANHGGRRNLPYVFTEQGANVCRTYDIAKCDTFKTIDWMGNR